MLRLKTGEDLVRMREACQIAALVLDEVAKAVAPGVTTWDLDQLAKRVMEGYGAKSACYNYKVQNRVYPAYTCLSVNEEIIHGIGSLRKALRPGDIIAVDVVTSYRGWIGDNAKTVAVGRIGEDVQRLMRVTEAAMYRGIEMARPGKRVADISRAIQQYVESHGYSVVREFQGHGVGKDLHEDPGIPNYVTGERTEKIRPGMTLAIEPMVAMGRADILMLSDGWTAITRDRKPSAHFEHTVLVTEQAPEILTVPTAISQSTRKVLDAVA